MNLRTTNLYLTAYLLANQINPNEIISEGQNKRKIIFVFPQNKRSENLVTQYQKGTATVKVHDFCVKYEFVRDLMFSKLREI